MTDARPPVYYGHHFPDDVETLEASCMPMDQVSPYPPEFVHSESRGTDSPYAPEWKWQAWVGTKIDEGWEADEILAAFLPVDRPEIAQYLNALMVGFNLRSEFRSEAEAEAFWAHVGEDERTERSNLGEHGMAQVPDPGE